MAADTFSTSLGAILQGTGNNNNAWGLNLNEGALQLLDTSIAGVYSNDALTGGNLAMDEVVPPAGPHPLPQAVVVLAGTLASDQTVTVPDVSKLWLVANDCTGAFALKFKTTSGTAGAVIPQGGTALVYCDGANNIFVGLSTSLRDVQWLGASGTIALPGVSFAAEPSTGLRWVSAGVAALTIGGVDIATFSATGVNIATGLSITAGNVPIVPPGTEVNSAAIIAPTGWYFEFGQTVARSTDANLMAAITAGFNADTHGTVTLTNVTHDLRNLGLEGSVLEGIGMATGAAIVSVDSASQITMSISATNTAAGGLVTAFPFGNGDGSTTFTLPDARGTVAAGRTNMGGTALTNLTTAGSGVNGLQLNTQNSGAQNVTLTTSQIPAHVHANSLTDPGHGHQTNARDQGNPAAAGSWGSGSLTSSFGTASPATTGITINNASAGTGGAHNNVQPTRVRNVLIKR
jgi:microcystin-dependent protein